jgi:hypothetical protein
MYEDVATQIPEERLISIVDDDASVRRSTTTRDSKIRALKISKDRFKTLM